MDHMSREVAQETDTASTTSFLRTLQSHAWKGPLARHVTVDKHTSRSNRNAAPNAAPQVMSLSPRDLTQRTARNQ